MSTIKVNKIENTSTTDGGVSIDNDGHVTIDGQQLPTTGPLSNRNIVINGAMNVAQRGTSQTITANTIQFPCVDRIKIELGGQTSPNYTYSQDSDAPSGFVNSFKILNNASASQSSTGTIYNLVGTNPEQIDTDCLAWGTADAKPATVSFWVKSNVTGNNVVELIIRRNGTNSNDSIAGQITINAADTWEYKTIVFPGATTNIGRPADNGLAFNLFFSFQGLVGGNKISSYGTWDNNNRLGGPAGDTNVFASTSGAYMNITGVQLEVGSKATPFEHESYSQTLAKCKRYFEVLDICGTSYAGQYSNGGYFYGQLLPYKVEKRDNPSSINYETLSGTNYWVEVGQIAYSANTLAHLNFDTDSVHSTRMFQQRTGGGSSPTRNYYYMWEPRFKISVNSEL